MKVNSSDGAYPDISNEQPGGYSGGAAEYQRLKRAMLLDRKAALESASWGLGQIMGFNAATIGYASAEAMVEDFKRNEDKQLEGFARFLQANPSLLAAFRNGDWKRVAFYYNGPDYAANEYDTKLAAAHTKYAEKQTPPIPDVQIRTAQAQLTYLSYNPRGVDGEKGTGTTAALIQFQKDYNRAKSSNTEALNEKGDFDNRTKAALSEKLASLVDVA